MYSLSSTIQKYNLYYLFQYIYLTSVACYFIDDNSEYQTCKNITHYIDYYLDELKLAPPLAATTVK